MALLTLQPVVDAGTAPTMGAATVSDTVPYGNGHNVFLRYKNGDSVSHTVTIAPTPGSVTDYGAAYPNKVVTIAASAEAWIPLHRSYDNGTGVVTMTLDAATSMTVAAVQVAW